MDEEKDLKSNDQDSVDSNDASDNSDVPLDEQGPSGGFKRARNGYRSPFLSGRRKSSDGIKNSLEQNRRNPFSHFNSKSRNDVENKQSDIENNESKSDVNVSDTKNSDKVDNLSSKTGGLSKKIKTARQISRALDDPEGAAKELAKEAAKAAAKALAKKALVAIGGFIVAHAGIIFLVVLSVLIIFAVGNSGNNTSSNVSYGECGFTISSTSLSKDEYRVKLNEFAQKNSKAKVFAENADSIYDLAVSSNINPELVIVRAHVEGYSPGAVKNNYWGMGCTNEGGYAACITYSSFMSGVKGFVDNISKYSSLADMMSKYAYIGPKWTKGSSSYGGCYYFEHIDDYYADTPEAQAAKQRAAAACAAGGTGIATNKYDQEAYATYQVDKNMAGARETIFGLTDSNTVCSSDNVVVSENVNEIIKLSDAEAWNAITGLNHKPKSGEISQSGMSKRMITIEVPYRTWPANKGDDQNIIGKVGKYDVVKKTKKITVNKAVAPVFKAFFEDVYNYAPNFVIRSFDGCYVFRAVTGGTSYSAHAFGVACDINASSKGNGYGQRPYSSWADVQKNVSGRGQYEAVYVGSDVLKIAHKYTIVNGADWNSPNDAMHFSFIGDKTRDFAKGLPNK